MTATGSVTPPSGDDGLSATGDNNDLFSFGCITTTGANAYGFLTGGHANTVTNSGTVQTGGFAARGQWAQGDANTVTNSGSIFALNARSILIKGTGNTVTLLEGSRLFGDVAFLSSDNTLAFGSGLNASVRLSDAMPNTITAPNDLFVVDGNFIHAIDSTGFVASDQGVADLGAQVLAALDRLGPGGAAPEVTQGTGGTGEFSWGGVIASVSSGGGTDTTAEYRTATGGVIGGHALDADSGFFLGLTRTQQESDSSFEADTTMGFAGLHRRYQMGGVTIDASLTAGLGSTDQTRIIANNTIAGPVIGEERAEVEYDTTFLMPAVTFSGDMDRGSDSFTPSLRLRYGTVQQDGYTETGGAAPLTVADRDATFLELRLQLERGLNDKRVGDAQMTTNMRVGFGATAFSGDEIDLTVAGQALSFGVHNDDVVGRVFAGVDMMRVGGGSEMTAGFEAGVDTNQRVDLSGGVEWVLNF